MIGVIYKNGKEIDRGIWTGGKHFVDCSPSQSICICDYASASEVRNERCYEHTEEISFREYQENDHIAYDSNIRKDNTIYYELPRWMSGKGSIPDYGVSLDEDGNEEQEYLGSVK